MTSVGIPIKLLHEAVGHTVTCELKTGEIYRGTLVSCEDNMNSQLSNVTMTARDGRVSQLETLYVRGSLVRFFIIPDMLKNAPMFKKVGSSSKGRGVGMVRGKATVARAQQLRRGGSTGGPSSSSGSSRPAPRR